LVGGGAVGGRVLAGVLVGCGRNGVAVGNAATGGVRGAAGAGVRVAVLAGVG
jgi:hypothetical protein